MYTPRGIESKVKSDLLLFSHPTVGLSSIVWHKGLTEEKKWQIREFWSSSSHHNRWTIYLGQIMRLWNANQQTLLFDYTSFHTRNSVASRQSGKQHVMLEESKSKVINSITNLLVSHFINDSTWWKKGRKITTVIIIIISIIKICQWHRFSWLSYLLSLWAIYIWQVLSNSTQHLCVSFFFH